MGLLAGRRLWSWLLCQHKAVLHGVQLVWPGGPQKPVTTTAGPQTRLLARLRCP